MDNLSENMLIKKEQNLNIPDTMLLAPAPIKTEPKDETESDFVNCGSDESFTMKTECFIKTEPIDDCVKEEFENKSKSFTEPESCDTNVKIEQSDQPEEKFDNPIDLCTTQIDFENMDSLKNFSMKLENEASSKLEEEISFPSAGKKLDQILNNEHEQPNKKKYTCEFCQKSFGRRGCFNKHLIIHSNIKPYNCHMCEKTFNQKSNLNSHLLIHLGEKPHICDICFKAFTKAGHLDRHKLIHTDIKPYSCDHCEKKFRELSALVKHNRIHSGEKPYACTLCDKAFTLKSHLINHNRVHSGEKPFQCEICLLSFTQKANLYKHKKFIHNPEKPFVKKLFSCDWCDAKFTHKKNISRHKLIRCPKMMENSGTEAIVKQE